MIDLIRHIDSGESEYQATCNACGASLDVTTNLTTPEDVNEQIEQDYHWYANGDVHYCKACKFRRKDTGK